MQHDGLFQFHGDQYDARIRVDGDVVYAIITKKDKTHVLNPEALALLQTLNDETDGVPVDLQGFVIDRICENAL